MSLYLKVAKIDVIDVSLTELCSLTNFLLNLILPLKIVHHLAFLSEPQA